MYPVGCIGPCDGAELTGQPRRREMADGLLPCQAWIDGWRGAPEKRQARGGRACDRCAASTQPVQATMKRSRLGRIASQVKCSRAARAALAAAGLGRRATRSAASR